MIRGNFFMKPRQLEILVGLFVLAGVLAVAYLAIQLGSGGLPARDTYLLEARFTNAGGLTRGGSVHLAGVFVGRVEEVRIDPEDFSAIALLRINKSILLPEDTFASIKTSGLIGDKYVALAPGAEETLLKPGDRITMTESAVDLESLIGKVAFGSVNESASGPPAPEPGQTAESSAGPVVSESNPDPQP